MPQTTAAGHGLGTKSIHYITEKLHGNCQFFVSADPAPLVRDHAPGSSGSCLLLDFVEMQESLEEEKASITKNGRSHSDVGWLLFHLKDLPHSRFCPIMKNGYKEREI